MNTSLRAFAFLFLLAVTVSCKTVRVLPNKAPVKRVDLNVLANEITKAQENIKTFRARIRAVYDDQKRKQQVNINFRLQKDKSLWMSANMLIPIAKLLVTPETVQFYEKFQKTYYQGDINFINQQLGTNFDFEDLQNIFLGNPITDLTTAKLERISHPKFYVLSPKEKKQRFRPTYFFDPANFRLKEQRFMVAGTTQTISIKYTIYQQLEGKLVPKQIDISTFDGQNYLSVSLEFLRVDFPKKLSMPFSIPPGYQKIEL